MGSRLALDDGVYLRSSVQTAAKILVVGHFAVGKTTFIGTMSEIPPLRTEEIMTQAGAGIDDPKGAPGKTTTTVAMDFGLPRSARSWSSICSEPPVSSASFRCGRT